MKRVCAYCRVSTEQDDQLNSLENQKRYFEQYIGNNVDWEFCGLYVDEGISGTSAEKRADFMRMVADAENKKFDLLLTKEISRFARNTLDSIFYTRKLKGLGVGVLFMNDNINTLDNDAELRLTIMSSIAQEESRKTSERVKWGQKRCMERGVVFGNGLFGYHLKSGKLTINEEQAKVVRLIFDLYLSGKGIHLIRKELEKQAFLSPSGNVKWNTVSVLWILKNEKYAGILKQKKTLTTDYLSHKKKTNRGEEQYIIIEDNHAPIVDKDIFYEVQKEINARRKTTIERGRYSNRYVWSGKIKCAYCNSSFKRRADYHTSPPRVNWQCSEAVRYGKEKINVRGQKVGCNCASVSERVLRDNFLAILNMVIENKDRVVEELKTSVRQNIADSSDKSKEIKETGANIEKMAVRQSKLIDMCVDGLITKAEYEKTKSQYEKQLAVLNKQWSALDPDSKAIEDLQQKLNNIETAIENLVRLKEFGDSICEEVLHKVVIEGREKISFYLKSDKNAGTFIKLPLSLTLLVTAK
ncbi:MAG: recombinase family protein [Candidatus Bathyarchaeota archaeon]|uniref:recombinase family protein n=1 Tax=Candidatus Bathycorpusculum sp. TaxID=2994959 RepID=UPI00281707EA|nr:recombinase family protein [Candidatus Termiticorpusculum sp.]MCL2292651.1 recombinase family protein [Candidatus Termiticorpusculum sp.]